MRNRITIAVLLVCGFFLTCPLAAKQIEVTADQAAIFKLPAFDSVVLRTALKNSRFEIKGEKDGWFEIILPRAGADTQTTGFVQRQFVRELPEPPAQLQTIPAGLVPQAKPEDRFFLMGLGMLRLNWASVQGDDIRFRYSDLGLPADFSTRERASFMMDGTFAHQLYTINGHLNYDPENRINEPPLDFLINIGNNHSYLSVGDYQTGLLLNSVFLRYNHPVRGAVIGMRSNFFGIEAFAGAARGQSGSDELPATAGSGPYFLHDAPILRGSELLFLVTKSSSNPGLEIKREPLVRNRDYFIDYDRSSIIFSSPLYSSDSFGNPVFILATYQFEAMTGSFSRAVYGMRAFFAPVKPVKLSFSYLADAGINLPVAEMWKNSRDLFSLGLNVDTKPVTLFGELARSAEPSQTSQNAAFGGGIVTILPQLKFTVNAWTLADNFPTFANSQLQYGYSLFQIFPAYAERNMFLSPFQFTRNLGAELYPFSVSRLFIGDREAHGILEWEDKINRFSLGYGSAHENLRDLTTDTLYLSAFHNGDATKYWGKIDLISLQDTRLTVFDSKEYGVFAGVRQRVAQFASSALYTQADIKLDAFDDYLTLLPNTLHQTYSLAAEFLTGQEGFFANYSKDILSDRALSKRLTDADIFELGVRRHFGSVFFADSRYRQENILRDDTTSTNRILGLGLGIESPQFRALGRYEIQWNESGQNSGQRNLWSLYLFGSPIKRLSVSLQYYNQLGHQDVPFSLSEQSESQLNFRLLWRPTDHINIYSQWRYDTNMELFPPLDSTRSNSVASVQGIKIGITQRLEFLANYKLLSVWGPIENRKNTIAAELGYLIVNHFRLGLGAERIEFSDSQNPAANYLSTVGYFKLVVLY